MPTWTVDFDAPYYLLLLAALPLFWFVGRQSLQAMGKWRRRFALAARTIVAALIILALAEPNWMQLVHRLSVLFVVDGSSSIQREELASALEYVNTAVDQQRDAARGDRAGVVVFGRDATTEIPPLDHSWRLAKIESSVDPRFTNLESALKLAEASFPHDSAKRVVVVSDGNENFGRAGEQASRMLDSGIGIDVLPIRYHRRGDVVVERLDAPANLRSGTPFELRVVLNNISDKGNTAGKLRVTRKLGDTETVILEESLALEPGKQVFTVRQELDESGLATYEALFVPDDRTADVQSENNTATAFCQVTGKGRVLIVEDAANAGQFNDLADLLRRNEIDVDIRDTRRPFDNLADLQQFDTVILADVARVTGEGADELNQFSDEQIRQLVQNTQHFGCGLVVLGGPNSYGAGGWRNTELEKAMPVDFKVDDAKVEATGALMLVIDSSGSMTGEKIGWAKAAAAAASEMLGPRDFLGVVAFDFEARWISPLQRNGTGSRVRARISRLGAAGGTNMLPGLQEAYRAIQGVPASIKHVIALTDGQTPKEGIVQLARKMQAAGITTTGVAVGPDADRQLLSMLANGGGGKFYHVRSPKAIPRIFMREARRVAMPLVFEDPQGVAVNIESPGDVLAGVGALPPITGHVLTTVKENPLVEVLATTPRQPQPNSTILATWTYGLGRAAALTTDIGQRWAASWPSWDGYEKFLLQLVRWSMRSTDANERLALSTDVRDGKIRLVVTALDRDEEHLNYLSLSALAVRPNGELEEQSFEQTAPGRYVATIAAAEPGNYYLSVHSGSGAAPLRTAVEVLQTAEFDRLASNEPLLEQLAAGKPRGGDAGQVIGTPGGDAKERLTTNVFRPGVAPAGSRDRLWPLALLAASLLFVGDILCRRVLVTFEWLRPLVDRLTWRRPSLATAPSPRLERLKHSKATISAQIERKSARADLREFDDAPSRTERVAPVAPTSVPTATAPQPPLADDNAADATSYTSRLLAAKQRARQADRRAE